MSSNASNDKSDPQSTNDLISKSIVSLHPIEKKILSILYPLKEKWITDNQLIKETELSIDQIRRGIEWLKFKNLILIEDSSDIKIYLKNKSSLENNDFVLPERKLVNCIKKGNNNIVDIIKGVEFDNNKEVFAAIKFGKNNNWINLENNSIFLLPESEFLSNEEKLIEKLIKSNSLLLSNLNSSENTSFEILKKRPNILDIKKITNKKYTITDLGISIFNKLSTDAVFQVLVEKYRKENLQLNI